LSSQDSFLNSSITSTPPRAGALEVGVQELPDLQVELLGFDDPNIGYPLDYGAKDFVEICLRLEDERTVFFLFYNSS